MSLVVRVGEAVLELELDPVERHRVCMLLGIGEIDLTGVFVTFIREALTDEERSTKYNEAAARLAEFQQDQPELPW